MAVLVVVGVRVCVAQEVPAGAVSSPLRQGRVALAGKKFAEARRLFAVALQGNPGNVEAEMGLADADLGLRRFEAAEVEYRRVVAAQPELWIAHKNLVITEAALGRWEEFDRERALLRSARDRGAAGIRRRESDVIDTLDVRGQHWIVREYYEPLGRSQARYNFERFSAEGKVLAYVSLEDAEALAAPFDPDKPVVVGAPMEGGKPAQLALNWYDGKSHGTIRVYEREPAYETVRAETLRWLRARVARRVSP